VKKPCLIQRRNGQAALRRIPRILRKDCSPRIPRPSHDHLPQREFRPKGPLLE
jgi:hypothetical protein